MGKVYIVLLNFNGWYDTIECVESLMKLKNSNVHIVICDNNSQDGSIDKIKQWAEGKIDVQYNVPQKLRKLVYPLSNKPILFSYYEYNNGVFKGENKGGKISLVRNNENNGFSAGNNVGIRFALQDKSCNYVWILNNDTIVKPDTLQFLIDKVDSDPKIGIVGSVACDYKKPDIVQKIGASLDTSLLKNKVIGSGIPLKKIKDSSYPELNSYCGASFLLKKAALAKIGLMNEKHFLYLEEEDYTERAKKCGYSISVAYDSIFYHKESVSTGKLGSAFSHYHFIRSLMVFVTDFYPDKRFKLISYHLLRAFFYMFRFKFKFSWSIIKGMYDGLKVANS